MADGVAYGGYELLTFGEVSKRQMASFDVAGSVEVSGVGCVRKAVLVVCACTQVRLSSMVALRRSTLYDVTRVHAANSRQSRVGV